jgi:Protein of unknown function (DUF3634)
MPALLIVLLIAALIAAMFYLNQHRAPPTAKMVIEFDGRKATLKRGSISAQTLHYVSDVLKESESPAASVAILNNGRVWMSKSVPANAHQRIRNLL